ncbi:UvrB/UvrC motif-containing protein [Fibrobacterota bacterium]
MAKIRICTHCGFTWDEFLARKSLGCQNCYTIFTLELRSYLTEIHSSIKHTGLRQPAGHENGQVRKSEKIARLRELISRAVRQEKFEDALKLKREIIRLEGGNGPR